MAAVAGLVGTGAVSATWSAFSSQTSNGGNTFATASSFGPACANQTLTPYLMTGLEHGRVSNLGGTGAFDLVTGMTADTATVRSGSYSMRAAPAGSIVNLYKIPPASEPDVVVRFALRLASLPGANVAELFKITATNNGGSMALGYDASSQSLTMTVKASTAGTPNVATASSTVQAGTWYTIDLHYTNGSSPHTAAWEIDSVAQTTASAAGTADSVFQIYFGTTVAATYTANYDDIVISLNGGEYPIGAGKILALTPDGMGASVGAGGFLDDDGTAVDSTSWLRLDEIPMTSKTDWITQPAAASGAGNYAEMTFEDTAETCIRAVWENHTNHVTSTGGGANNPKLSVYDGTFEASAFTANWRPGTAGPYHYSTLVTPASAPWTKATLDGLVARFGYGTDLAPQPYLNAVLLEYEVQQ